MNELDWRMAFLILGDLAWLVVIPARCCCGMRLALLIGSAVGRRGLLLSAGASKWPPLSPHGGQPASRGQTVGVRPGVIFRSWPFWAIALTHFACCAAHSGPIFHLVTHAIDQGVARMSAAGLLGLSGLSSIFGRVGTGIVADRVGAKPTLIAALALQAFTVFPFLFVRDLGPLSALTFVFGIAYGASMPLYALVTREYFGEQALGTAFGAVFFISCIGHGARVVRRGIPLRCARLLRVVVPGLGRHRHHGGGDGRRAPAPGAGARARRVTARSGIPVDRRSLLC